MFNATKMTGFIALDFPFSDEKRIFLESFRARERSINNPCTVDIE